MPIVFSAFVPHSPILIEQIGKENLKKMAATETSYQKLAVELAASQAETILIISPHGHTQDESFTMNLNPEFSANLEEFGDFTNKKKWPGNIGLTYKIREKLETAVPLQLISQTELDYGTAVPLLKLTAALPKIKIIPLYFSGLTYAAHFKFGQLLQPSLMISPDNIAIIASGDLSHRVTKDAPAGYSPKGKKFDKKVIDSLLKNKSQDLVDLDPDLAAEAGECGFRSLLILLGIIDLIKYQPLPYSYEAPFGVGYAVMQFKY